jgi:hypothetical protein
MSATGTPPPGSLSADRLGVQCDGGIAQRLGRMSLGQLRQSDQQADARSPRRLSTDEQQPKRILNSSPAPSR